MGALLSQSRCGCTGRKPVAGSAILACSRFWSEVTLLLLARPRFCDCQLFDLLGVRRRPPSAKILFPHPSAQLCHGLRTGPPKTPARRCHSFILSFTDWLIHSLFIRSLTQHFCSFTHPPTHSLIQPATHPILNKAREWADFCLKCQFAT